MRTADGNASRVDHNTEYPRVENLSWIGQRRHHRRASQPFGGDANDQVVADLSICENNDARRIHALDVVLARLQSTDAEMALIVGSRSWNCDHLAVATNREIDSSRGVTRRFERAALETCLGPQLEFEIIDG